MVCGVWSAYILYTYDLATLVLRKALHCLDSVVGGDATRLMIFTIVVLVLMERYPLLGFAPNAAVMPLSGVTFMREVRILSARDQNYQLSFHLLQCASSHPVPEGVLHRH